MPRKPTAVPKKTAAEQNCVGISDDVTCLKCNVRMSRRFLKKPDVDTGLIEVVYRCPIMRFGDYALNRRMKAPH